RRWLSPSGQRGRGLLAELIKAHPERRRNALDNTKTGVGVIALDLTHILLAQARPRGQFFLIQPRINTRLPDLFAEGHHRVPPFWIEEYLESKKKSNECIFTIDEQCTKRYT